MLKLSNTKMTCADNSADRKTSEVKINAAIFLIMNGDGQVVEANDGQLKMFQAS